MARRDVKKPDEKPVVRPGEVGTEHSRQRERPAHAPKRCPTCGSTQFYVTGKGRDFDEKGWFEIVEVKCVNDHVVHSGREALGPSAAKTHKRPFG